MKQKLDHHVLAFDVEASGSSLTQNGIVSIGASLQDKNSNELMYFQVNLSLPRGRIYEEYCLENFWLKNSEAYNFVNQNPQHPKIAMKQFCEFLEFAEEKYPNLILVSDNPSFDIAWLNFYIAKYTERFPINYSTNKNYRMIFDIGSIKKTLLYIKEVNFETKWVHNHNSLNDARRIADLYNQIVKELNNIKNLKQN
jgi:DNA polymerase III epsilon subunit-like protein